MILSGLHPIKGYFKVTSIGFFCCLIYVGAVAQEENLTEEEKQKVESFHEDADITATYIETWRMLLKLKTYVDYRNLPEVKSHCDTSKISDQFRITLKSGLSWDMEEGPPEKPNGLFLKNMSEKGRSRKDVTDWDKYLLFIRECQKYGGLAFDMVEKVDVYINFFNQDRSPCMVVKYEFNPLDNRKFEQSKRDIWVYEEGRKIPFGN